LFPSDVNDQLIKILNASPHIELKNVIKTEIDGIKIAVSHIPGQAETVCLKERIDVFIHGHTHRRKIEKRFNSLVINPGALTEDGRYFLLSLPDLRIEEKVISDPF